MDLSRLVIAVTSKQIVKQTLQDVADSFAAAIECLLQLLALFEAEGS